MADTLDGGGAQPPAGDTLDGGGVVPTPPTNPVPGTDTFGVTVSDVRELATHIARGAGTNTDPDFGPNRAQITDAQIARWITYVADSVRSRIIALSRWSTNTGLWSGVVGSARTAVVNGAAAYLVSAAFPGRAGTNDQTNYSAELQGRFDREMAFLMELPAVLEKDEEITPPVTGSAAVIRLATSPARITDDSELFHHTRGTTAPPDPNIYRRTPAPGGEAPWPGRAWPGMYRG